MVKDGITGEVLFRVYAELLVGSVYLLISQRSEVPSYVASTLHDMTHILYMLHHHVNYFIVFLLFNYMIRLTYICNMNECIVTYDISLTKHMYIHRLADTYILVLVSHVASYHTPIT